MVIASPPEIVVDVWKIPLRHSDAFVTDLFQLLSPEEQARASRFRREGDRQRFTVAHAAVRLLIADYLSVDARTIHFQTAEHGKPFIPGMPVQFNLSHSGELALLAVTHERNIGIDVEEDRQVPDAMRLAERFFSKAEIERMQRLATDPLALNRGFLECWTRKEAFIKAVGYGLSYPLNSFEVTFFPEHVPDLRLLLGPSDVWHLRSVDVGPGYYAALVLQGRSPAELISVRAHDWHTEDLRKHY